MAGSYDSVMVFSATKFEERARLGDKITAWISTVVPRIVETVVVQSSDKAFHCLTIVIFYDKMGPVADTIEKLYGTGAKEKA